MLKEEFCLNKLWFNDCPQEVFYRTQFPMKWKYIFPLFRLFVFVYMLAWLIPHAIIQSGADSPFHWYLTNWGEVLLTLYFLFAFSSLVHHQCTTGVVKTASLTVPSDQDRLHFYYKLHWIIFNIASDVTVLAVLLFWTLAARTLPSSAFREPIIYHLHLVNLVLLVCDVLLVAVPVRLLHFVHGLTVAILYVLFTLILHWTDVRSDIYPDVLDWAKQPVSSALYSLLGAAVVILSHFLVFLLFQLRLYFHRKWNHSPESVVTSRVEKRPESESHTQEVTLHVSSGTFSKGEQSQV